MSKCVLAKQIEEDEIRKGDEEQKFWKEKKTKDLMKKWVEFKDGKTPFENGIFM